MASGVDLAELARRCLAAPPRCGDTTVIAVDGRSGAGKSVLTAQLTAELTAQLAAQPTLSAGPSAAGSSRPASSSRPAGSPVPPVQVVRLDDVYPGWDGLPAAATLLVRWLLQPLASGRPAGHYRYDWRHGRFVGWRAVAPGGLLLLDGVGSGATAIAAHRSLLLWLQAPEQVRRARAITRDGAALARRWQRWADQERRYLERDAPERHADLVLDTTAAATAGGYGAGPVVPVRAHLPGVPTAQPRSQQNGVPFVP